MEVVSENEAGTILQVAELFFVEVRDSVDVTGVGVVSNVECKFAEDAGNVAVELDRQRFIAAGSRTRARLSSAYDSVTNIPSSTNLSTNDPWSYKDLMIMTHVGPAPA